ncbi:MAG: type II secretion system F family protein [Candidatus Doudnabacteria bacterium]|nr:type II secretion system F family protein [Candidatus Doudnabacteria bacterium]
MPQFSYVAHAKDGSVQKGTLLAKDRGELSSTLRSQGLLLISADEDGKKGSLGSKNIKIPGLSGVKMTERVLLTRHLQIMIKAGLSITHALQILEEQTENTVLKEIISDVKTRVERGQTLTDSLKEHPKVFPPFYTSMVAVGELGGTLEETLDDLAEQLKKDYELVAKVRGAMLYPVVILSVMLVVAGVMIVYVLPQLVDIFRDVDADLPITTRALIGLSDFVQQYGFFVLIGIVLFVVLLVAWRRTEQGKRAFHWTFIHFPLFGDVIRKVNLARFANTTSILLASDISIVETFKIVRDVVANVYFKDIMTGSAEQVKKGVAISEALGTEEAEALFPPVVRQMVSVGEQTGTLDSVLADLGEFYEKDVTRTTDNLSSIIEPVLMVILGAAVGIVAVSVISPIYSLIDTF